MSVRRFALIDPAAGISGDMVLGALVDLGLPATWLRSVPERLGLEGVTVEVADVIRCGMRSTKVSVLVDGATEGPGDVHHHDHGPADPAHRHDHHHESAHPSHRHGGHPHRHVRELLAIIAAADVTETVKATATRVFRELATAEGRIHGTDPEAVALHEVGAFDALVDIVGAVEGFERLGVAEVYRAPVALGSGWVKAAHGDLPVPAPATAILVEGLAIAPNGPVRGEATTPTGAALLRVLASGPLPGSTWRPVRSGWGAGGRDPNGYANTLRIVIGEIDDAPREDLTVLATDLDDLNPEYLEPLRAALMTAGAVDVQCWSAAMKKGRTGYRVEAQVPAERVDEVTEAFFRHSTTAGVRAWPVSRTVLERTHWTFITSGGHSVRMKTLLGPDGPSVKPEYDDIVALAGRVGQPPHRLARMVSEEAARAMLPAPAASAPERGSAHSKESLR